MFSIERYTKEDGLFLANQNMNSDVKDVYINGAAAAFEETNSVTGKHNGVPMVCGGTIELWPGRASAWTIFNEESKHCFIPVFRGIRSFLKDELKKYRRIEICVPVNFELGHRRAKLLGFTLECAVAKGYLPDGTDCSLYSMVRE